MLKKTLSVVEEDSWEDKDVSTETEKVLKKFFQVVNLPIQFVRFKFTWKLS